MSHPGLVPCLCSLALACMVSACGDRKKARSPAEDELTIVVQTDKSRIAAQEAALSEQGRALQVELERLRQEVDALAPSKNASEALVRTLLERAVTLVRSQEGVATRRERLAEERDALLQRLAPLATPGAAPVSSQELARLAGAVAECERQVARRDQEFAEREGALAAREKAVAAREAASVRASQETEKGDRVTNGSVERSYRGLLGAMEAKGILTADLAPARQRALQEAAGFRNGGDLGKAMAAIEALEAAVGALAVDGEFVSRKVDRVNAMHSALENGRDAPMRDEVGKRLEEVARAYSDGRFGEANRALNAIVLMLDRVH